MEKDKTLKGLLFITSISFFFFLGRTLVQPLLPLFIVSVGASKIELGLILSVAFLISLITRIPFGILSDRFGRWYFIPAGLASSSLAFLLFFFTGEPSHFYPAVSLLALSWALFGPSVTAIVSDMGSIRHRGEIMGKFFMSTGLAMVSGPLLASILTLYLNYRETFLLTAIPSLIGLLIFFILGSKGSLRKNPIAKTSDIGINRPSGSLGRILHSRNVLIGCYSDLSFSMTIAIFATLFPVYAEERLFFTPALISLLFAARGITNALMRMPSGRLSDHIGRKKPYLIAISTLFFVYILISEMKGLLGLTIAMLIYGAAWGMRVAPSHAFIRDNVPQEDAGVAMALLQTTFDAGKALGSIIAGIAATLLPIPLVFKLTALLLLPPILAITLGVKEKNRK